MTQNFTGGVTGMLARMAEERRREAVLLAENKTILFDRLATTEVASVFVEFDGGGDSGQIECIEARSGDDDPVELPADSVTLHLSDDAAGAPRYEAQSLRDAIETLAYACLYQSHAGWENNDGGFGTFRFDVAERAIHLEMNTRFSDVQTSDHAF